MTRPLYLHIGASKTGTSALQQGLWASTGPLLEKAGIGIPYPGRPAHVKHLLRPLGWVMASGFVTPMRKRVLKEAVGVLRKTPGDALLISNEDLCEIGPRRIEQLYEIAAAADLEPRVILTARDWGQQLPSEWQQFLKHRLTMDYPTFLSQVRAQEGEVAQHFWQRQDFAAIADRFAVGLSPDDVHVVAVPTMKQDPNGVFSLFGEVVGFDPELLDLPTHHVNASFGYVESEVFRRLNAALGDRLTDYEKDYLYAVRYPIVRGALARSASARLQLPAAELDWVTSEGRRQVEQLRSRGYRTHGDLDRLVAGPEAVGEIPELDEAEVSAAAIDTLANFTVWAQQKVRETRQG